MGDMTEARCPMCRKPADPAFRPFCSKHCADLDLSRWLKGAYVIEGVESAEDSPDSEDDEAGG
jgi:endogenous inhibitor of DNA gyrase (YacG/DUF329 family)